MRSKAYLYCSNSTVMGSNLIPSMALCTGLATGRPPVPEVVPNVYRQYSESRIRGSHSDGYEFCLLGYYTV
jgi:hypothetical protein